MNRKNLNIVYLILSLILLANCTTQKNTFITRTYHNITSKYNILFNESESYKKGLNKDFRPILYKSADKEGYTVKEKEIIELSYY